MNRRIALKVLLTLLSVLLATLPVLAARPLAVHIEAPTLLPTNPNIPDRFEATGPGVDAGLLSSTGDVYTFDLVTYVPPGAGFTILRMIKHFEFDDLSGTIDVRLVVRLQGGITRGIWRIINGTGAYANLRGSGRLVGTPIVLGQSVLDVYDGWLR